MDDKHTSTLPEKAVTARTAYSSENTPLTGTTHRDPSCSPMESQNIPDKHSIALRMGDLFPQEKTGLREGILATASFLLRELASDDFCGIRLLDDDPSGARLRHLAIEIADDIDTIRTDFQGI